jgi:2'-5' RNA ligase
LPEEIKKQLLEIIRDLENQFPENTIKWTQPENLHITIFFFGNKNENEIKNIIQSTFDLNIENSKSKK